MDDEPIQLNPDDGSCPNCGGPLKPGASPDSCPRCLFGLAMDAAPGVTVNPVSGGSGSDLPLTVGDYEIIEEIARGGMGVVFKARQKSLGRLVALKMILRGDLATEETVRRFRLEAEAVASLDHPHIVPVYETGEDEGLPYFSMKLIENARTVSALGLGDSERSSSTFSSSEFRRRQADIAQLMARIGRALDHAHQRGILHRDLKPGNILIDTDDEPHVTDFGLAKLADDRDSGLTLSTTALGSPSYMPPEVAAGGAKNTTQAADIYGLGAVLYELLTGRPPFVASSAVETLRLVMEREPVPPRSSVPTIARDLETICLNCLSKKQSSRFSSAAELADELERFARGEPIRSRPVSSTERALIWCRRHPARTGLLAAMLMITCLGVAGIAWQAIRATNAKEEAEMAERRALREAERAKSEAAISTEIVNFLTQDVIG